MSTQLLIAGFHRSGTSLLAQLLQWAGLFLGDELLGAKPSNPYGHFEDVEVVRLHEAILAAHGQTWQVDAPQAFHVGAPHWEGMRNLVQRRDAAHDVWGFKDPRVCLFLGAWKHLMPDARVIVVYRDPAESCWSLERRQAEDLVDGRGPRERHLRFWTRPDYGIRLWTTYNRSLLRFVRAHREDCMVVPFTHLQEGFPLVAEVNRRFGTDLEEVPTPAVFDPAVTSRRPGQQVVLSSDAAASATEVWHEFEQLTSLSASR